MRSESLLESIGNTPLIGLKKMGTGGATVYAKLELNGHHGHKERFAASVITSSRESGQLKEGAPIVESSSGTLALGLGIVGRNLGHPVHIVTDPRTDALTLAKLRSLGVQLHIVESMGDRGWQGARLDRVEALLLNMPDAFWPRQYENPLNPMSLQVVGEELVGDLEHIDAFIAPVGSGGLISGTARVLKRKFPKVRIVAVDCVGSAIFCQPNNSKRLLNGVGNSLVPDNVEKTLIDEVHWVSDREGFDATRNLALEQQIFAGGSSGAAYMVSKWVAAQLSPVNTVVVVFPDRGDRYLETIYNDEFLETNELECDELLSAPQTIAYGTPVSSWSRALLR